MLLLSEVRVARGLSQSALAARAGVSVATIGRLERRATLPRPHVARRLGAALGLDPRQVAELRAGVRDLAPRRAGVRPVG